MSGSVVEDGRLTITAERIGAATTMAGIASFLRVALDDDRGMPSKAAELADRRVTITLVAGLAVLALTRDVRRLEALFLVDFSCAVKLGTSVAIKTVMGRAARRGVLVKGGAALEGLAAADTVVFDKTGTLTHNALDVATITCLGPHGRVSAETLIDVVRGHGLAPYETTVPAPKREQAARFAGPTSGALASAATGALATQALGVHGGAIGKAVVGTVLKTTVERGVSSLVAAAIRQRERQQTGQNCGPALRAAIDLFPAFEQHDNRGPLAIMPIHDLSRMPGDWRYTRDEWNRAAVPALVGALETVVKTTRPLVAGYGTFQGRS